MSTGLYAHTTRAIGTVLTAAIYNSDHQNHITNLNPTMMGGYGDNITQMQLTSDPGGLGSEVLAANLAAELQQIRFAIKRIQGTAQWYQAPATDLSGAGGPDPLVLSFLGQTPLTLRRQENTTAEVEVESVQSGSGVGNKWSRRIVGGGANNVGEVREYLGVTELYRTSTSFRIYQTAQHFNAAWSIGLSGNAIITGNPAGYFDFAEVAVPANPAADTARMYCKAVGGLTRLAYRDSVGAEQILTTSSSVPATVVEDVRLGSITQTAIGSTTLDLAAGSVVTGWVAVPPDPKAGGAEVVTHFRHKPIQQKINGSYATITG